MERPNPKNYLQTDFIRGVYEKDLEAYIDHLEQKASNVPAMSIKFLEWSNKGLWSKWESRLDGVHEMPRWYNTYNYAAMKQPLSSQELYELFISEFNKNDQ